MTGGRSKVCGISRPDTGLPATHGFYSGGAEFSRAEASGEHGRFSHAVENMGKTMSESVAAPLGRGIYSGRPPLLDLFGNLVEPPRERGRPEIVIGPEGQARAQALRAAGWTIEQVAEDLGVTAPTLRKHCVASLRLGLAAGRRAPGRKS